jgi:hypothetical protein
MGILLNRQKVCAIFPSIRALALKEGKLHLGQKQRERENQELRFLSCVSSFRRLFTPAFITIQLKPQMKTYRCLWWLSTTNHNILYFVGLPRIPLLNTGICLWKAQNTLSQRRFRCPNFRRPRFSFEG